MIMPVKRDTSAPPERIAVDPWQVPIRTVVAFDNSAAARSAVRLAASLATDGRISPILVEVSEPTLFNIGAPPPTPAAVANAVLGSEARDGRHRVLKEVIGQVVPEAREWPMRLGDGDVSAQIDAAAVAEHAPLVIMGLRPHRHLDRTLRLETTVEVVRRDHVSVLGVLYGCEHRPRCIVVGTDFGQAGERAARLAATLLAPGGRLILVYAEAMFNYDAEDREGVGIVHDEGVRAAFEKLRAALDLPAHATVEGRNVDATPAQALLDTAGSVRADLIAIGRQRHSAASRALLGSVSTDLLRDAHCSVLVTSTAPWSPRRGR